MSNFKPSGLLQNALTSENRDRESLIYALIGYINGDPYFETGDLRKAYDYLIENGVTKEELFEDFDPSLDYIEDESKWTDDYYSISRVFLKENFCINRFNHVQKVGAKLKRKNQKSTETTTSRRVGGANTSPKYQTTMKATPKKSKMIVSVVFVVVIVVVVIILLLTK